MWVTSRDEVTPLPYRITEEGGRVRRTEFFGDALKMHEGPQGFLVEHETPHRVIKPHFHRVRQFQVIVAGDGHLGKKAAPPISFHYADPYTPYGPIVAGAEGISFFTLRPSADVGIYYMPESRGEMIQKAGRNVAINLPAVELARAASSVQELIPRHSDGLAAFRLLLGAGEQVRGPEPSGSGGQYYLLLEGSLQQADTQLPRHSILFVEATEPGPLLTAGASGADLLVLQFPALEEPAVQS